MTTEEKAKAYDEALKVLHKYDGANIMFTQDLKEEMFPELKESEDESIIRDIRVVLESSATRIFKENGQMPVWYDRAVAWLEKQGEHKKFRDSIQVGDKVTRNEDGVLVNLSQLNRVAKKDEQILANSAKTCKDAQKPAWSEEDDEQLSDAIFFVREYQIPTRNKKLLEAAKEAEEWLKSLKDRVQPQPKQEWSEEDDRILTSIWRSTDLEYLETQGISKENAYKWIFSIKDRVQPQTTWKPSDEQMEALKEACDKHWEPDGLDPLYTLYQDLKKLRGE